MAGFSYRGQISGAQDPILENLIISSSDTIVVGDVVSMNAGFVIPATSATINYGICVGIVSNKGIPLDNVATSEYDGVWTSSSGTYVATSDNETDKKVRAVVCSDPFALWYNDSDATLTTAMLKMKFHLITASQIDGDTNSATAGDFQLWKLDPDADGDASKGLFRMSCWQGFGYTPT